MREIQHLGKELTHYPKVMYKHPSPLHTADFVNTGSDHKPPFSPGTPLPTTVLSNRAKGQLSTQADQGLLETRNNFGAEMSELRRWTPS